MASSPSSFSSRSAASEEKYATVRARERASSTPVVVAPVRSSATIPIDGTILHSFRKTTAAVASSASATLVLEQSVFRANLGRLDEADAVRDRLPRDVEGRAVIHGAADERQSPCDRDRLLEVERLAGDVPLVVVHREDRIVLARLPDVEHRVCGHGPHRLDAFPQRLQNSVQTTTPHVERALQQTRMDYLFTLAECMANDPRQVLRNGYALLRPATMATTGDRLEVVTQAATYRVEVQGVEKGALLGDKTTGKSIRERMEEVW